MHYPVDAQLNSNKQLLNSIHNLYNKNLNDVTHPSYLSKTKDLCTKVEKAHDKYLNIHYSNSDRLYDKYQQSLLDLQTRIIEANNTIRMREIKESNSIKPAKRHQKESPYEARIILGLNTLLKIGESFE